jgi:hypothetical protein
MIPKHIVVFVKGRTMANAREAATRILREINGRKLELPESQLEDLRVMALDILNRPVESPLKGQKAFQWPSETERTLFGSLTDGASGY